MKLINAAVAVRGKTAVMLKTVTDVTEATCVPLCWR